MKRTSMAAIRNLLLLAWGLLLMSLPVFSQTNAISGLYFRSTQAILFSADRWVSCLRDEGCSFGTYAIEGSKLSRESYSWWGKEDFKRNISFEVTGDQLKLGLLTFDKVEQLPERVPDPRKAKFLNAQEIAARIAPGTVSTREYEWIFRPDGTYSAKDLRSFSTGNGTWALDGAGFLRTENPQANRKFRYVFYDYDGITHLNGERTTAIAPQK